MAETVVTKRAWLITVQNINEKKKKEQGTKNLGGHESVLVTVQ